MSDLVGRLRRDSAIDRLNGARAEYGLTGLAADRIEQLERVLADARMVFASVNEYTPSDIAVIFAEQIAAIDEAMK